MGIVLLIVDLIVLTVLEGRLAGERPPAVELGSTSGSYRPKLLRSRQRGMRL